MRQFRFPVFLFILGVVSSSIGHGFYEFGRGELLLHTRGTVTYDSNVFAQEVDPEDDILLAFNPELQYVRRAGRGNFSVAAGVIIGRYVDLSDQDFENYYADFSLGYPVSPASSFSGGVQATYRQTTSIDDFLNERTETEAYNAQINNRYRLNEKIGLRNSFAVSRIERERRTFSRIDSVAGSLGVAYYYSENLDFTTTYRLRHYRTSGRTDRGPQERLSHAVTVGANGDLTQKLSGSASVGMQHTRNLSGGGRPRDRMIFGAGLSWAARINTTLTLDASRDLELSPEDRTVERTSVRAGVTQRLTQKMTGNLFAAYRLNDYKGAEFDRDVTYSTGGGLNYTFTDRWNGSLDYAFNHTDSQRRDQEFERHTVSLSTRYTF